MAASQQFFARDNTSDATFRVWGAAISAAIAAMGWVQTADTGQANWATATRPGASLYVYEIWRPNDALQTGATQFFFKMEYGSGSGGSANPSIKVSIGTSTNGAGTLTGLVAGGFTPPLNGAGNAVISECNFSGDSGRLGMMLWRRDNLSVVCVERTLDSSGNPNSEGVTIVTHGSSGPQQQTIVFGVAVGNVSTRPIVAQSNATGDIFNNKIPIATCIPSYGKFGNPMTVIGCMRGGDLVEGMLFAASLYGSSRVYMATKSSIGGGATDFAVSGSTNGTNGLIFRYD